MNQTEVCTYIDVKAFLDASADHFEYRSREGVEFHERFAAIPERIDRIVAFFTSDTFQHLDHPTTPLVPQRPAGDFKHFNNFYHCFWPFAHRFNTYFRMPETTPEFLVRFVRQKPELYRSMAVRLSVLFCVAELLNDETPVYHETSKRIDEILIQAYTLMSQLVHEEDQWAKRASDGKLTSAALIG
jgi:hypothetical protein